MRQKDFAFELERDEYLFVLFEDFLKLAIFSSSLVHSLDEGVDFVFSVTSISSLLEMNDFLFVTTSGRAQFERPQKLVHGFKVLADNEDLMNNVLNAENAFAAKFFFDDGVVRDGNALMVDFGESSFVDQLSHCLQIRCSVSDVRFNEFEHFLSGGVQTDENGVVDLSQSQQLQDLSRFGIHSVDTSDTNNKSEFGFGFNIEVSGNSGSSSQFDQRSLSVSVLFHIVLCSLEDHFSLVSATLFDKLGSLDLFGLDLLSGLSLLKDRFWNWDLL